MHSHEYNIDKPALLRMAGSVLGGMAIWTLLLHTLGLAGILPSPRPVTDVDSTILIHQADAARNLQGNALVLLGDSSCLMDVDASQLTEQLRISCLNLGTLSYLDLDAAGQLLRLQATPPEEAPQHVVLLMHPEALRRAMAEEWMQRFLSDYLDGRLRPVTSAWLGRLQSWTGLATWKACVLDRFVSAPLSGAFGRQYGFCRQLEDYMKAHRGSALDPRADPFAGSREYQLAASLEAKSRMFASTVPTGTVLSVGITPIPGGFAPEGYAATHDEMLQTWASWLGATHALRDLPESMPDRLFATATHLNKEGVDHYTRMLAQVLEGLK